MAYHTDEFLEKRQDDPKWREAYLERKKEKRLIMYFWIGFIGTIVGFFLVGKYTDLYDVDEILKIVSDKVSEIYSNIVSNLKS